ncbi:MAG: hypothetical protein EAS48_11020 [Chryseobacterium sp.]|nr:MAG: hypothetical protein EAS48_11020 [Chryseobacterium sp.]
MKKITLILVAAVALASCESRQKAIAGTPTTGKLNTRQMAAAKSLYENSCGKCHVLHAPSEYTAEKWKSIIDWMAPRAKLDEQQKQQVFQYVSAHASDAPAG